MQVAQTRTVRVVCARMLVLVSLLCACGDASVAVSRAAIRGGAPSPGDDAVFMIRITNEDAGLHSVCSATRIAPRTLLTAAHCVDPVSFGVEWLGLSADNTMDQRDGSVAPVAIERVLVHPEFRAVFGLENDLALVRLGAGVDAGIARWNRESIDERPGDDVRSVGFGADSTDGGAGLRQSVTFMLRQVSATLLLVGDLEGVGICHGDSGGPTFSLDGTVLGVHSFTRGDRCVDGADTRVDVGSAAELIKTWLDETEDTCGADGVCSRGTCTTADVDCVPESGACRSPFDCDDRLCVDARCARRCVDDTACPEGFRCANEACVTVGVPPSPPTIDVPAVAQEFPAATSGCSSSLHGPPWVALCFALLLRGGYSRPRNRLVA